MDFYFNGKYSAFDEFMYYYHWDFAVYYILVLIVFINCIKSTYNFITIKKGCTANSVIIYVDLFSSILAGIGLFCGAFFQGILSDISSKYSVMWGNKIFILAIIAFVLFIIQLIFVYKTRGYKNKQELF